MERSKKPSKRKSPRVLLATMMALALLMSLAITPAMAATVPAGEDELAAQAIAETAKSLRLSVTDLQVKEGDTYVVRLIPFDVAHDNDWEIDKAVGDKDGCLVVDGIDAEKLTITLRAVKTGKVRLDVKLKNPTLDALVEANPGLAKYVEAANAALAKAMFVPVTTGATETKAVAGVDAGGPASALPVAGTSTTPSTPTGGVIPR